MVKNKFPFNKHGVYDYINSKKNKQVKNWECAQRFGVTSQDMLRVMQELIKDQLISAIVIGNQTHYCIQTEEQIAAKSQKIKGREFKEMVGYDAKLNSFKELCLSTRK